MAVGTVRVHGLRELNSALKRYDRELQRDLDASLLEAGLEISNLAAAKFSFYDAKSAMGFRPRMRGFGRLVVEQRYRKTTGQHPEFGSLQMQKALLPARAQGEPMLVAKLEHTLDTLGRKEGF